MPQTLDISTYTKTNKNTSGVGTFVFETTYSSDFYPNVFRCYIAENALVYNDKVGSEGFAFVEFRGGSANAYYDNKTGEFTLEEKDSEIESSLDGNDRHGTLEATGSDTFYWYVYDTGALDYYEDL